MDSTQARVVLRSWGTVSASQLTEALDALVTERGGMEKLFADNPLLRVHPRDTVDERSLGIHQTWSTNVMAFEEIVFHDTKIYLFEHHIEALCETEH